MNRHYGYIVGDYPTKEAAMEAAKKQRASRPNEHIEVRSQGNGRWRVMGYPR